MSYVYMWSTVLVHTHCIHTYMHRGRPINIPLVYTLQYMPITQYWFCVWPNSLRWWWYHNIMQILMHGQYLFIDSDCMPVWHHRSCSWASQGTYHSQCFQKGYPTHARWLQSCTVPFSCTYEATIILLPTLDTLMYMYSCCYTKGFKKVFFC